VANESEDLIAGGLNPVLTIKTDPEGAEVWSHGNTLGITTASGLMAPWKPGTILELKKTGYSTETLDLSAPPDNTEIMVKLSSALTLYTNPWGASVKVNGELLGTTTYRGITVPWDGATIEIQKAGYRPEMLKFVAPPNENQSSVELQPAISSVAPKRHPLEVVGYAMAAIVLWLLPLVIYSGLHTAGVEEKVTDKDSQIANLVSNNVTLKKEVDQKDEEINSAKKTLGQERLGAKKESERLSGEISQLTGGIANLRGDLNKRDNEIARLKKVELEKERLEREIPSLKSEADRWRKDYYSQNQVIASKDQEIARLKHKPPEPSRTIQDEGPKLQKLTGSADAAAQAELGDKYFRGVGVTKNYDEAFGLFKKSATMGNAHAQSRLGWMYEAGFGVAKDKTEALNWYKEASRQGDVFAKSRLRALSNH
jgi:hypothetical protein